MDTAASNAGSSSNSGDTGAFFAAGLQPLVPAQARQLYWKVDQEQAFVDTHGALYAELSDLKKVRDGLRTRIDAEKKKANPLLVDLDDDDPPSTGTSTSPITSTSTSPDALTPETRAALESEHEAVVRGVADRLLGRGRWCRLSL